MHILVFSNSKSVKNLFTKLEKSKKHHVEYFPFTELKKVLKDLGESSFIYYDISNHTEADIKKMVRYLVPLDTHQYGIIDTKGVCTDIAEYFHNGSSDYIGKLMTKEKCTEKRFERIVQFGIEKLSRGKSKEAERKETGYILPGSDWKDIRSGNQYTFTFMFIELDNMGRLKDVVGADHLNTLAKSFKDYISSVVEQINGKVWMSMDFTWLVLLPFDGKRCSAVLSCLRLMLDRYIISTEYIGFNIPLSYRIALHIGNTTYKKQGDTGSIVSDSINSTFHLGQKYAEPGNFYITQDIFPFIPRGLSEYFLPAGIYEGRRIMRMRLPL